ncbi:2-phospho-L-lactate guanylyltransferase [Agromyces protaetiae]|uniref:Phosphoenolpyruvate guanylyltransferase n=1 Tax=Agromyces protaetiae TaxID=2509455 RepID=A0A4P6FB14_9MICO|nr:2-phospho-L-lactate guanylyltransferase [Agromyces protaetiae]QAY72776.1 2-phospho-L-lactate guanylyltransferase [Agromyces protaetiae]
MSWTVVIPVKSPARAKTRLAPELDPAARAALARAFATDTVAVALATPGVSRVLVVGDEPALAGAAEHVLEVAVRGLGVAITDGIAAARSDASGGTDVSVAVLLGDLPALRADELAAALDAASGHPLAFVRDADGTGTTLATARAGVPFAPRFGHESAREHAAAGFVELEASDPSAWPTLRRDVDTAAALADARALGVGPATSAVLHGLAAR